MIERPSYLQQLLPYVDAPLVKILTGVRRCGKSSILELLANELKRRGIAEERIVSFRFDSLQYDSIKDYKALYRSIATKLTAQGKFYVFLDEVQEVADWERAVNSIMVDFDVDIYVTGSNSRMLSSEISTYLTGRYVSIHVLPLSFAEYLHFKGEYADVGAPRDELMPYLQSGGFPAVHLRAYGREEIYTIVRDIYNSAIFRDIVQRNKIRRVELLERIVKFAFDNVGKTFSAKAISDYLKSQQRKMDVETVYNYLSLLEKAYILYRCPRFDLQGKEILKTQEKFYLVDPALKYAVLGYQPTSVSAMLENLVYLELRRRAYDVYVGKMTDREIDFVATRQNDRIYVQVSREITTEATAQREYAGLLSIRDNYPKYVLRTDAFAEGNYEGVKTMHIADFLLMERFD